MKPVLHSDFVLYYSTACWLARPQVLRDDELRLQHDRQLAQAELRQPVSFQDELHAGELHAECWDGAAQRVQGALLACTARCRPRPTGHAGQQMRPVPVKSLQWW